MLKYLNIGKKIHNDCFSSIQIQREESINKLDRKAELKSLV